MDLNAIYARILQTVDEDAYLTPSSHVDPRHRVAMALIESSIRAPDQSVEATRELIHTLHDRGRIDRVMMLSALHVVAASPQVRDYVEAARLAGEQELAVLDLGGDNLQANMASVERHRGVLAFIRGQHEVALDYFARALERQRTAENLGNILCSLLALGEIEQARELYQHSIDALGEPLAGQLSDIVSTDPDLALLRAQED